MFETIINIIRIGGEAASAIGKLVSAVKKGDEEEAKRQLEIAVRLQAQRELAKKLHKGRK